MAQSSYIFAGTYAYVLTQKLLSETQRELLLGAQDSDALKVALQDTFLGTYLSQAQGDIDAALDLALVDTKKELLSVAPNQELLSVLWLEYDFYNAKTLLKRTLAGGDVGETDAVKEARFRPLGNYSFERLSKAISTGATAFLHPALGKAVDASQKAKTVHDIDAIMDRAYLETALEESEKTKGKFLIAYVGIIVDLFNLRTQLRLVAGEPHIAPEIVCVGGCNFNKSDLVSEEQILKLLTRYGGDAQWKEAIAEFESTRDFTLIDKAAEEYVMHWLKKQSIDMHSPAPLVAYLVVMKENIQFIRTVKTAKYVGLSEKLLRDLVRKSFTAYVY